MQLIITIAATGIFATDNNIFDMWIMCFFGIVGYLMRKLDITAAPTVLALVIARLVENSLRQSLTLSHGSVAIFFTPPISATLIFIAVISLFFPLIGKIWAGTVDFKGEGAGW